MCFEHVIDTICFDICSKYKIPFNYHTKHWYVQNFISTKLKSNTPNWLCCRRIAFCLFAVEIQHVVRPKKKRTWRNSLNCVEEWRCIEKTIKKNGWRRKKNANKIELKKKHRRKEITYSIYLFVDVRVCILSFFSASLLHFDCSYKNIFCARAPVSVFNACVCVCSVYVIWFSLFLCARKKKKKRLNCTCVYQENAWRGKRHIQHVHNNSAGLPSRKGKISAQTAHQDQ